MRHSVSLAALLILVIGGCHLDRSTLAGRYVAQHPFGTETVVLNANGTFLQDVRINGASAPLEATGRWEYVRSDGDVGLGKIELRHCLAVNDGLGALRPGYRLPLAMCTFAVERDRLILGRVVLGGGGSYPLVKQPS